MAVAGYMSGTDVANPLDMVEQFASAQDWLFDRPSDDEIAVRIPGQWCDYSLHITWNIDVEAVHFTCTFDMRVPYDKRIPVYELLALANEQIGMGHFCMWNDEGLPLYRHVVPLRGAGRLTRGQMEDVLDTAVIECERFFPAFQYVLWGGKSAAEAINLAMIETVGEA